MTAMCRGIRSGGMSASASMVRARGVVICLIIGGGKGSIVLARVGRWTDQAWMSRSSRRGGGRTLFHVDQVVFVCVGQSLPAGVDDVFAHADRTEDFPRTVGLVAATLDDNPDGGGRF